MNRLPRPKVYEPCESKLANILASLDNLPQTEQLHMIIAALTEIDRMLEVQGQQIRYLASQFEGHEGLKAEDADGGLTETEQEKAQIERETRLEETFADIERSAYDEGYEDAEEGEPNRNDKTTELITLPDASDHKQEA